MFWQFVRLLGLVPVALTRWPILRCKGFCVTHVILVATLYRHKWETRRMSGYKRAVRCKTVEVLSNIAWQLSPWDRSVWRVCTILETGDGSHWPRCPTTPGSLRMNKLPESSFYIYPACTTQVGNDTPDRKWLCLGRFIVQVCIGPMHKHDFPRRGSVRVWVRVRVLFWVRVRILLIQTA